MTTTTTGYTLEHVHTTTYGSTYKCKELNGTPLSEDMQDHITLLWDGSGYVDSGDQTPALWAGKPVSTNKPLNDADAMEVSVPAAVLVAGLEAGLEPDAIEDAYMGEWDSAEDMAYDMWNETGMLESVPEAARGYIDWAMVARDMVLGGDVTEANGHYFHAA